MLYPSINEVRKKADSKYTLVILAAKRARDIIDGKPVLRPGGEDEQPVSEATYELAEDFITYTREEELAEEGEAGEAKAAEVTDEASPEKETEAETAAEDETSTEDTASAEE